MTIAFSACLLQAAHAWPPTFAPEITFTHDEIFNAYRRSSEAGATSTPTSIRWLERARDAVAHACQPACTITPFRDRYDVEAYRVTYPDGSWFELTLDPAVIEIKTMPVTLAQFQALRPRLQHDLWDPLVRPPLGLEAGIRGGGHINIGADEAFGGDVLLIRNFLVDYWNHEALSWGVLGRDPHQAPHPTMLRDRRAFERLTQILAAP